MEEETYMAGQVKATQPLLLIVSILLDNNIGQKKTLRWEAVGDGWDHIRIDGIGYLWVVCDQKNEKWSKRNCDFQQQYFDKY